MSRARDVAPEFSRPIAADRVGRDGLTIEIEASAAERAALARRFGLLALDELRARCQLRPVAGGMIELTAQFDARAVQECVVTLEPVPAEVHCSVEQRYALDPAVLRSVVAEDEMFDPEADDPPEALAEGAVDLGEAVAQQLAISLDPYPRAPGAEFAPPGDGEAGDAAGSHERHPAPKRNPFALLGKLKE